MANRIEKPSILNKCLYQSVSLLNWILHNKINQENMLRSITKVLKMFVEFYNNLKKKDKCNLKMSVEFHVKLKKENCNL